MLYLLKIMISHVSVSTWGNDKEYWRESATALATMYFFMQGTPFIYQGQEIGMTNVQFDHLLKIMMMYNKNLYHEKIDKVYHMKNDGNYYGQHARDNSRTPMQWDR